MLTPLLPHPAAMIRTEKARVMVVADLHMGWEIALSRKGIHVPTQTYKLKEKLSSILSTFKPSSLMILGDIKHTVATAEIGEWQDVPDFFSQLGEKVEETCVVKGNHDGNLEPLLPEKVRILPSTGVTIGEIGLFHGHRWPSPNLLKCRTLIMGHVHPVIAFYDPAGFRITRQVWVKIECDRNKLAKAVMEKNRIKIGNNVEDTFLDRYKTTPKTSTIFIAPSFNDFLGGRPLNRSLLTPSSSKRGKRFMGPILGSEGLELENGEIYLLDGTFLGTLSQLRAFA